MQVQNELYAVKEDRQSQRDIEWKRMNRWREETRKKNHTHTESYEQNDMKRTIRITIKQP